MDESGSSGPPGRGCVRQRRPGHAPDHVSGRPSSGGAEFFDGQQPYQSVTWAYQGHTSTETFGAHGQRQGTWGTGIVNGKLQAVQVDCIRHQWELVPGNSFRAPVNACTNAGFLDAPSPGTNWPLLIVRTLACGGKPASGQPGSACG